MRFMKLKMIQKNKLRCSKCKEEKSTEDFQKGHLKNGFACWCKACVNKANREWYRKNHNEYYKKNKRRITEWNARNAQEYRNLCLNHYGNKCEVCGSTKDLQIDHINGIVVEDRKRTGVKFWRWLVKNNFPTGFRTLCCNCNLLDGQIRICSFLNLNGINDLIKLIGHVRSNESPQS